MYTVFICIKMHEDAFEAAGLETGAGTYFSINGKTDEEGFLKLSKNIDSRCKDPTKVFVAIESKGFEHAELMAFLRSRKIKCLLMNPFRYR